MDPFPCRAPPDLAVMAWQDITMSMLSAFTGTSRSTFWRRNLWYITVYPLNHDGWSQFAEVLVCNTITHIPLYMSAAHTLSIFERPVQYMEILILIWAWLNSLDSNTQTSNMAPLSDAWLTKIYHFDMLIFVQCTCVFVWLHHSVDFGVK